MREATTMDELRRGVRQIDVEHTLADYGTDVTQINAALESDSLPEAKAAIADVLRALRAVAESGFPVGAEADLADLVGFDEV